VISELCVFDRLLGETLRPGGLRITSRLAESAGIHQNQHILDCGCGKGATAVFLAEKYRCRVMGIDLSEKMISSCRSKITAGNLSVRVDFLVADGEYLPFCDSSFEAVISECSLSLFPGKKEAVEEMRRVLKPGGRLAITDIVLRGKASQKLQGQIAFPCCLARAWRLEEYLQLFAQAGFRPVCFEDLSNELEEVGFQLASTLGTDYDFLDRLPSGPCRIKKPGPSVPSSELLWRFLRLSRPGYALMVMRK
jgi:arsenite methyltransferase